MKKRRVALRIVAVVGILVVAAISAIVLWLGPHSAQQILSGTLEVSEPADVRHTAELTSKYLSVQYPGNWRIDTDDPDYDPDRYFDINAPAQGKVMVHIFPAHITPRKGADSMMENLRKYVQNATETHFESWGPHRGYGVQSAGHIVAGSGRIRAFGFGNSDATVVIVEMRYDEDEANNRSGYDLISQTFKLRADSRPDTGDGGAW